MFPEELKNPKTRYLEKDYLRIEHEILEISRMRNNEDLSLVQMAEEEISLLSNQKEALLKQARDILASGKKSENKSGDSPSTVILEVRAGTGGDEASIFALNLAEMYEKYSAIKGWRWTNISESKNSLGGYKEAIFEIKGKGVYELLKHESGVHRVQRIPVTEKAGRIHTSTASIAILPEQSETDVELKTDDMEISFTHSGGPGGQNVNKVETAVRIVHKPSGITVLSQSERSQGKNKEKALSILRAKIGEFIREEEAKKQAFERKEQVGTSSRSEKIRTYNYPQDRVTDHRVKESWHNIPRIMQGEIDPIVKALNKKITSSINIDPTEDEDE